MNLVFVWNCHLVIINFTSLILDLVFVFFVISLPSPDVSSNSIYNSVGQLYMLSSYQPGYHFVLDYRYAQASKY